MESLLSLKASIAEILALTVLELFPGTILGHLHLSDTQFRYAFHFRQPKHPELLPLLEEKMRGVLKSQPVIEEVEMAVSSAIHYFEDKEQLFKAEMTELSEDVTVPMVRIGSFYDLMAASPYVGDFAEVAFQLLEVKEQTIDELKWIEISGTAFFSKDELKAFIKHRKTWLKEKPWEKGINQGLYCMLDESIVLLPEGMKWFHQLEVLWRKSIQAEGSLQEIKAGNPDLYPALVEKFRKGIAEWGVEDISKDGPDGPLDICYFPASLQQLENHCISSLQFIQQTFNMLELSADWVLCEKNKQRNKEARCLKNALEVCGFPYTIEAPRFVTGLLPDLSRDSYVELRIYDSLGERWPGPFLKVNCGYDKNHKFVEYSLLGPIKRLIALMAEAASKIESKRFINEGEMKQLES